MRSAGSLWYLDGKGGSDAASSSSSSSSRRVGATGPPPQTATVRSCASPPTMMGGDTCRIVAGAVQHRSSSPRQPLATPSLAPRCGGATPSGCFVARASERSFEVILVGRVPFRGRTGATAGAAAAAAGTKVANRASQQSSAKSPKQMLAAPRVEWANSDRDKKKGGKKKRSSAVGLLVADVLAWFFTGDVFHVGAFLSDPRTSIFYSILQPAM